MFDIKKILLHHPSSFFIYACIYPNKFFISFLLLFLFLNILPSGSESNQFYPIFPLPHPSFMFIITKLSTLFHFILWYQLVIALHLFLLLNLLYAAFTSSCYHIIPYPYDIIPYYIIPYHTIPYHTTLW